MPKPIQDQVVVVTGASSGVGRATARAFGARGARLGLIARTKEALTNAAGEVCRAGGDAMALPLDVSDADAVERAAAEVEQRWGRIDTWVNVAMVTVFSPVKEMKPEEYRRVTEVDYLGYVYGTLAALHRMLPRDEGMIIQIGSALAYRAIPLQSAYCASKFAIRGFTDALRSELLHDGSHVHLSMLQLPAVNTPQFDVGLSRLPNKPQPVPPIFEPEVIADAVLWAAEHPVREMAIGWPSYEAILAQDFAPGLADRYLARTAYKGQQTDEKADPDRPNNLWSPVPGDRGARGSFTARARDGSPQLWARIHSGAIASVLAGAAGAAGVAGAVLARRRAR